MINPKEEGILRRVLHGESPWSDLQSIGIEIKIDDEKCDVFNPKQLTLTAGPEDLAQGIINCRRDLVKLREWAFFILGATIYDMQLKDDTSDEILLDALWSFSAGKKVEESVFALAEAIVKKGKSAD